MAGLSRPSTVLLNAKVYKDVDARHKAGHDDSHYRQRVVLARELEVARRDS
jgi:hypothetical protein